MNDIGFYTTQRRYRLERIIIFIFSTLAVITMYTFGETLPEMGEKLESSLAELSTIRKSIAKEKLPMVKGLNALEDDVIDVRLEHQKIMRQLDSRNLDLNNLRSDIKARKGEKNYISNLLIEYIRKLSS